MSKPIDCSSLTLGEKFDSIDEILARNDARLVDGRSQHSVLELAVAQVRAKRSGERELHSIFEPGTSGKTLTCQTCHGQGSHVERLEAGVKVTSCKRCNGRGTL